MLYELINLVGDDATLLTVVGVSGALHGQTARFYEQGFELSQRRLRQFQPTGTVIYVLLVLLHVAQLRTQRQ